MSAGLFLYPLLQAADVLAYRADEVPVGDDQRQHVELMREIARGFNARFGEALVVPEHRIPAVGARIMDLQIPRRMSTTASTDQGAVYILDEPDAIRRKFKRAVTDSGREIVRRPDKPGISNLIDILAAVRETTPRRSSASSRAPATARSRRRSATPWSTSSLRCASATRSCARDEAALEAVLAAGAEKARAIASGTVADVREAMGVGPARRLIRRGGA